MEKKFLCGYDLFFTPISESSDLEIVSCENINIDIHENIDDVYETIMEEVESEYYFTISQTRKNRSKVLQYVMPEFLKLRVDEPDYME